MQQRLALEEQCHHWKGFICKETLWYLYFNLHVWKFFFYLIATISSCFYSNNIRDVTVTAKFSIRRQNVTNSSFIRHQSDASHTSYVTSRHVTRDTADHFFKLAVDPHHPDASHCGSLTVSERCHRQETPLLHWSIYILGGNTCEIGRLWLFRDGPDIHLNSTSCRTQLRKNALRVWPLIWVNNMTLGVFYAGPYSQD